MGAGRRGRKRGRTRKSKRKPRQSRTPSKTSQLEIVNSDECDEAQDVDRLLLSSLRFWEVERDLIEERLAARKSAKGRTLHRPDIAA